MACKRSGVRIPLAPQVRCMKSILRSVPAYRSGSHSATGGLAMVGSAGSRRVWSAWLASLSRRQRFVFRMIPGE